MLTGASSPVVTDITRPPSSPEKSFTSPDQLSDTPLPNPGDSPVSSQWGSPVGDTVTVTAPAPAISFLSQASLSKTRKKNEGNKHPVQT